MKKQNTDSIDQLLSDTFDDYAVPEFRNSWPKIKKQVFKQQFLKFNVYQFNVYYLVVAVGAMITAGILLSNPSGPEKNVPIPVEKKKKPSEKTIKDTVIEVSPVEDSPAGKDGADGDLKDASLHKEMPVMEDESPERVLPQKEDSEGAIIPGVEESNLTEEKISPEDSVKTEEDIILPSENQEDSTKVLPMAPLNSADGLTRAAGDSMDVDSVPPKVKRVIVIEKPVVKTDTVVKVIRKRRRR